MGSKTMDKGDYFIAHLLFWLCLRPLPACKLQDTSSPSLPPWLSLQTLFKPFVSPSGSGLGPVCVCLFPPHQLLTKQILGSLNLIIKNLYFYHIGLFFVSFFLEINFIYFAIVSVCEGFPPCPPF